MPFSVPSTALHTQAANSNPKDELAARPYIGGQAVLEGVMMRAPKSFAIVVRRQDGSLSVRERAILEERKGLSRLPFFRGIASLVESLKLGTESLRFSAEMMEKDMAAAANAGAAAATALGLFVVSLVTRADGETALGASAKEESPRGRGTMGLMLAIVIAFFVALPQIAAFGVNRVLHLNLEVQSPLFQTMTGAAKLLIVISYLVAIRRVPEIRRVFQYHGAEHKTISTYEAGNELTVENARAKTTLHPRCGTTFLVMVALVSIFVFMAIGRFLPRIQTGSAILDNVVFFLVKLPFLPVIAGVTFELQRLFARYCTTGPLRMLLLPGFWVQKITTIEPDDAQLEVALASLHVTLYRQERGETSATEHDVQFENYQSLLNADRLRPELEAA